MRSVWIVSLVEPMSSMLRHMYRRAGFSENGMVIRLRAIQDIFCQERPQVAPHSTVAEWRVRNQG